MLAASEVGVDLARQKGVFGDVSVPRVFVERKKKQPYYADDYAKRRKVRWKFDDAVVAPLPKDALLLPCQYVVAHDAQTRRTKQRECHIAPLNHCYRDSIYQNRSTCSN